MKKGISVIIRNKNEAPQLQELLKVLDTTYAQEINEIILVDNYSTDNSIDIGKQYNCKIIFIKNFTYGSAINLGVENATFEYCVLLSSHVVPVGVDFFKNIPLYFNKHTDAAGLRFCRNLNDVKAYYNGYTSQENANKFGLLASGAAFKKSIWELEKFNEDLVAAEDKEWTVRVLEKGFKIYLIPSVYFYVNTRNWKQELKKYKIEKEAHYIIFNDNYKPNFKWLIKETYRAILNCIQRLKLVISRYYVDITFNKKQHDKKKGNLCSSYSKTIL